MCVTSTVTAVTNSRLSGVRTPLDTHTIALGPEQHELTKFELQDEKYHLIRPGNKTNNDPCYKRSVVESVFGPRGYTAWSSRIQVCQYYFLASFCSLPVKIDQIPNHPETLSFSLRLPRELREN